jgi:hypothetical protein
MIWSGTSFAVSTLPCAMRHEQTSVVLLLTPDLSPDQTVDATPSGIKLLLKVVFERKHKRALATIFPEEHGLNRLFPVRSEQSSAALKSTPTKNFRFSDSCA